MHWTQGNLIIDARTLADIEAHAAEQYPSECCGFISGPAGEPLRLTHSVREINEADKYHKLDPVTFPRTSNTYFKINELRAQKAFEQGAAQGTPIKVIYHSHCDSGAYFSEEDSATFAREGQLTWPCAFLVISVVQGKVVERRLWVHVPNSNAFEESPLQVDESHERR